MQQMQKRKDTQQKDSDSLLCIEKHPAIHEIIYRIFNHNINKMPKKCKYIEFRATSVYKKLNLKVTNRGQQNSFILLSISTM